MPQRGLFGAVSFPRNAIGPLSLINGVVSATDPVSLDRQFYHLLPALSWWSEEVNYSLTLVTV